MPISGITDAEIEFTGQRDFFLEAARARYRTAPTSMAAVLASSPEPLAPLVVDDLSGLSKVELEEVADSYINGYGVTHVVPRRFSLPGPGERHPLLSLAEQLSDLIPLGYAVDHPMETHPEAISRFGSPDGTLKLYNLPLPAGTQKYKEQAETNALFSAHNDGLGYAGLIYNSIIVLDRSPMAGGYTYFQNLVRLAPALAADDPDAFQALFLPDAISALRPRGKGAIRVTSPVFFVGRDEQPQIFFRTSSGEYQITWRDEPALRRARTFLENACKPFGPDSRFVHFMRAGDAVIINNRNAVHGRTSFVDAPGVLGRTLARKWFVPSLADAVYRHVPGVEVHSRWAQCFPDRFMGSAIEGEWHYSSEREANIRIG